MRQAAGVLLAMLMVSSSACRDGQDARNLVQAAIEAHGGRERLAALDNVKVLGRGRFKGQLETTGTISFVAPATWAVEARLHGNAAMRFGMDGGRCWRRDRQFVSDCSGDDAEYRRWGEVFRLRLLRGLDQDSVSAAGERDVGGTKAPAVRIGELTLAFDPVSHRLIEISSGNWREVYSDFRDVNGALVAAGRTFFIDGQLDAEETWDEILPGQADLAFLHPPAAPKDGDPLDEVDAERWVLTTAIENPAADLAKTVGSLDDVAQAQGQKVSASEGFVLTEPSSQGGANRPWDVSIGLERTSGALPSAPNPSFRFEHWPERRFLGVFHLGDPRNRDRKIARLQELMEQKRLEPVPGSAWQFVCRRDSLQVAPAERLCLLRSAVRDRSAR
jgi:hypothetical protein